MKQKAYILTGLAGSGKSGVAYYLQKECNGLTISFDELRKRRYGREYQLHRVRELFILEDAKLRMKLALSKGQNIVVDDFLHTNTIQGRRELLRYLNRWNLDIILVEVSHPDAQKRSYLPEMEWTTLQITHDPLSKEEKEEYSFEIYKGKVCDISQLEHECDEREAA